MTICGLNVIAYKHTHWYSPTIGCLCFVVVCVLLVTHYLSLTWLDHVVTRRERRNWKCASKQFSCFYETVWKCSLSLFYPFRPSSSSLTFSSAIYFDLTVLGDGSLLHRADEVFHFSHPLLHPSDYAIMPVYFLSPVCLGGFFLVFFLHLLVFSVKFYGLVSKSLHSVRLCGKVAIFICFTVL